MKKLIQALGIAAVFALSAPLAAQDKVNISIATGGTGGVYYPMGGGIAAALSKYVPGMEATAEVTGGSVDNLKLIGSGKPYIGLAMVDATLDAYKGEGKFKDNKQPVRTLMILYPNRMHVVSVEGRGVNKIADLKGKRVSTGSPGSATEVMAFRVIEAAGLDKDKDMKRERLGVAESVNAMKDGKIDAFFWVGGLPTAGVTDLANTPGTKIRMIDHADLVPAMNKKYGNLYVEDAIPKATYRGMDADNHQATVMNILVANANMTTRSPTNIVKTIFDKRQDLINVHKEAANFKLENQKAAASPIPFHPGVDQVFRREGRQAQLRPCIDLTPPPRGFFRLGRAQPPPDTRGTEAMSEQNNTRRKRRTGHQRRGAEEGRGVHRRGRGRRQQARRLSRCLRDLHGGGDVRLPPVYRLRHPRDADAASGARRLGALSRVPGVSGGKALSPPHHVVGLGAGAVVGRGGGIPDSRRRRFHRPQHLAQSLGHRLRRGADPDGDGGHAPHQRLDHAGDHQRVHPLCPVRRLPAPSLDAQGLRSRPADRAHVHDAGGNLRRGRGRLVLAHHPVHHLRRVPAVFGRRQVLHRFFLRGDGRQADRRGTHGGARLVPARRALGIGCGDHGDPGRGRLSDARQGRLREERRRRPALPRAAWARSSRRRSWVPRPS